MIRSIGRNGRYYSKPSRLNDDIANNVVFKSLNYVKQVDNEQDRLQQASTQDKVDLLMEKIAHNAELLYMLSLFHYECKRLDIYPNNLQERKSSLTFWYNHFFKLVPINNSFWDLCALLNISNHNHKLSRNIEDLGILDPKNFDEATYHQLQRGKFNSLDFTKVQTTSFTRPDFKDD